MSNKDKQELIKTLQNIFFANGVKCDSEQFLMEDIESLISKAVEQERQRILNLPSMKMEKHDSFCLHEDVSELDCDCGTWKVNKRLKLIKKEINK